MPFLGAEQFNPVEERASAKALKKALKASKKMAEEKDHVVQPTNGLQSEAEVSLIGVREAAPQRAPSPKVTIAQCPARLTSFVPPPNYGTVEKGLVFRSGFPQAKHLEFMDSLKIRSILSLVDTEPSVEFHHFMNVRGIQRNHLSIAANKEGGQMDPKSICDAILFAKDPSKQPVHIHCNQGKHRTGCVVACLRKYQGRSIDEILTEYKAYAYPKERPGDIEFIRVFDPKMVDAYAKCYAHSGVSPNNFRVDSKLDIWALSASIPDDFTKNGCSDTSMSSSYESGSDIMLMPHRMMAPWTRIRDFGSACYDGGREPNITHDNEALPCPTDVVSQTLIGSMDVADGDSDWDDSDTVAISASAVASSIAVSTRSSFSS